MLEKQISLLKVSLIAHSRMVSWVKPFKAFVAATAAAVFAPAYSAVVTVDFSSNPLSTIPYQGFYLNVVTGVATPVVAGVPSPAGYDVNPFFFGTEASPTAYGVGVPGPMSGGLLGTGSGITLARLAPGAVIGGTTNFFSGSGDATFSSAGIGYIGFYFVNEANSFIRNYGYLAISENLPVAVGSYRLLGYAYETNGGSIAIPVPETSTWVLMAVGLAGVSIAARRRICARKASNSIGEL